MRRYDAIKVIATCLTNEFVISCNGMISRELFTIKDQEKNFYMLGSMGLAPAIGLGVSLAKPNAKIVILAGDGNTLMSLGTLATIGKTSPKNFIFVVLDNECHESTGGQQTSSSITELHIIARSSGIKNSKYVNSVTTLKKHFVEALSSEGPSFLHVKVDNVRVDVPRVSIEPTEITKRFVNALIALPR
ncbi:MAG: thiamine pyrophosphate-dependent enzyme [Candidatus Bathyarchaeota archaeon]|nr:thiamine pyrophosphate-dependent enzyme [Candidatus Bathyarchaeum sp.]